MDTNHIGFRYSYNVVEVAGLSLETPGMLGRAECRQQQCYLRKCQTTPNRLYSLWTLRATTTGAPLPQGDALVTYKNLKREKKCNGRKNGCEMILDMKVVSIWCKGAIGRFRASVPGISRPHSHRSVAVWCGNGGVAFTMARSCTTWWVGAFAAIETGTRIMGLFGPIPWGCLTVSKTQNGL